MNRDNRERGDNRFKNRNNLRDNADGLNSVREERKETSPRGGDNAVDLESVREEHKDTSRPTQNKWARNKLQVMFFGGVDEIGKNMTALVYGDDILVIDCGVAFPTDETPGVDLVIPDMTYLKQNAKNIKGIVITHAHEDHIGSMPYFLDEVKAPVYASRLSLALIQNKLREFPKVTMKSVMAQPKSVHKIGCFTVEFINVNHSMAGSYALSITTPVGVVFVSGDFKIDFTPTAGETTDLARMGELGQKGVLLMLCESTNVEREGFSMSESVVGKTLEKIFEQRKDKRIIITSFASNVHRVQQIMDIARANKRKVAFAGRSMINNMEVAMKIGEIKYDKNIIIDIDHIKNYADNEILILGTGSQGQASTAVARMAVGDFPGVHIGSGDTIIFSSSPVPGNERAVNDIINNLVRCDAEVIYDDLENVHASGHAYKNEIMTIHKLIKPKFFMPVHGEAKMLKSHQQLAISMGMKPQNIIRPEIGMVVEVSQNGIRKAGEVQAGSKLVDGLGLGELDSIVLRDRKQLAEDGICMVVLGLNMATGRIVSGPEIIARGFIYSHEAEKLIEEAKQVLVKSLGEQDLKRADWNTIKNNIRRVLTNLFYKKTKRRPIIIPIVFDI